MPLPEVGSVWGAGGGCAISPCFPHGVRLRAGAAEQQPAREETPGFSSCVQLWHPSQNKINGHYIPRDCPLSLVTPPGEIPGMPVLSQLILPDSQIQDRMIIGNWDK